MTQVVIENIYKSFPARQSERAAVPVTTDPLLTQVETTPLAKGQPTAQPSEVSILRQINLTVAAGEFMVLVGPSGCGKSTLLRLIAGLEEITGGNVWVGDRLVNNLPPKQRDMAMVFQNYALYPHMTVYDNLAFGLRRTGKSAGKAGITAGLENLLVAITRSLPKGLRYLTKQERVVDQRVRNVAALLQIQPLLNRLPKQLSGGQKQRIALGRAIARNPQVFLMDEPLSNLDAKLRAETRAQIVKLQRQLGTTTIYVTHDQTEAMTMGDRIAVMNQGQIQQVAHPIEIYNYPATRFVAEFIGSPPMNFLRVQFQAPLLITHAHFRFTLPEIWATSLQKYAGQALILGIRPEHLCLSVAAPQNFLVQVELVEALGNDTYLSVRLVEAETTHASVNPTSPLLQVRISPDRVVSVGEQVWLSLTLEKIHLFDPETDTAIRPD